MKNSFQKNVENFIYSIVYDSLCVCSVAHLYPTLCDPLNCSWPGSSIHGIFQSRVMEYVALPAPGDLPGPWIEPTSLRLLHWQADSLPLCLLGSVCVCMCVCVPTPAGALSRFSHVQLFATLLTVAQQGPLSREFSSKNTGVGCHALLQMILWTQRWNR